MPQQITATFQEVSDKMFKSILKKGMDNLRFALNLDGYVPEHIMYELRNEQEFLNEDEHLEDIDEFNPNVEQIFSKSKLESKIHI